uniref:Zinc finger CCHC domain-containing protein 7 n=1 Tax=Knipowitschia caucasica TaxID=637954 RepID=A0AAV2LMI4_KNICA
MYCGYQYYEQLEDDLYREEDDDSKSSDADSELEFHLYSQLHYSSNAGDVSELEDERKDIEEVSIQDDHNITTDADNLGHQTENNLTSENQAVHGEKEKTSKNKKKRDTLKSQRASAVFEEVIVIDSGSDAIILSEDDSSDSSDNTEGVCALKGRRLSKLCTSTPAHEVKRVIDATGTVTLSSSESDSEPEFQCVSDSSSLSDSDDMENWMILGPGDQEGDQSISLNLDGVAEGEPGNEELGGSWRISDKDIQAQIFNKNKGVRPFVQRVTSRYYTDKNVHCKNCTKTGHLSKNCPEPQKIPPCFLCGTVGHIVSSCPHKHCNNCGLPGHLFNGCSERPYWHKRCNRCAMTGHFFDDCPEVWRQYHLTIKAGPPVKHQRNGQGQTPYCYNCAKKGHYGHECSRQRMYNGTYPSTPLINHYDTIYDIKCRQRRIDQKTRELKKFTPHLPQSTSSPGPPRKKQRTNLDYRNHRFHSSPSFKTQLAASSHIFFSDTTDSKKHKRQKHKAVSLEKPWKPKRPVPKSKETAIVLDEADDFPRGGGQALEPSPGSNVSISATVSLEHRSWLSELESGHWTLERVFTSTFTPLNETRL